MTMRDVLELVLQVLCIAAGCVYPVRFLNEFGAYVARVNGWK